MKLLCKLRDDPKVVGLTDKAFRVYILALCWCGEHETDGILPKVMVNPKQAALLLDAGLLDEANPKEFAIHNWEKHQVSRESLAEKRAASRERQARHRAESRRDSAESASQEVEVEVEVEGKEEVQKNGKAKPRRGVDNRPDSDQHYLDDKIAETWNHDIIGFAGLQKLNTEHGRPAVTSALRQLHGFPPAKLGSAYGYITKVCREQAVSA